MTNYTWTIAALECATEENSLNKVVKTVHWRYRGTDEPILNEDGTPKTSPLFVNSHNYLLWLLNNNKAGFLDLLQVYLSELLQNQEFKSKLDKLK